MLLLPKSHQPGKEKVKENERKVKVRGHIIEQESRS